MYVRALIYLIFPLQQLLLAFFMFTGLLQQIRMTEFNIEFASCNTHTHEWKEYIQFRFSLPIGFIRSDTTIRERAHLT